MDFWSRTEVVCWWPSLFDPLRSEAGRIAHCRGTHDHTYSSSISFHIAGACFVALFSFTLPQEIVSVMCYQLLMRKKGSPCCRMTILRIDWTVMTLFFLPVSMVFVVFLARGLPLVPGFVTFLQLVYMFFSQMILVYRVDLVYTDAAGVLGHLSASLVFQCVFLLSIQARNLQKWWDPHWKSYPGTSRASGHLTKGSKSCIMLKSWMLTMPCCKKNIYRANPGWNMWWKRLQTIDQLPITILAQHHDASAGRWSHISI